MEWLEDRLRAIRQRPIDLARHLDIKGPRVYEMLAGKRRLQEREIRPTAEFLGLTLDAMHRFISGGVAPAETNVYRLPTLVKTPTEQPELPRDVPVYAVQAINEREFIVARESINHAIRFPGMGPFAGGIHMTTNTMAPWKEIGVLVIYDGDPRGRPPREGEHAVIFMKPTDGGQDTPARVVRIVRYVIAHNGKAKAKIAVRQYNPDRTYTILQADIDRCYRVIEQEEMLLGYR